jgi:hypothetical protein
VTTTKAIAIFHPRGGNPVWLPEILDSIRTTYPIMITNHEGYQIDGLRKAFEQSPFEEIFFIQESMVVKDNSVWDLIFKGTEGYSVTFNNDFQMFLAKYQRRIVNKIPFPTVTSRRQDIQEGEGYWNFLYRDYCPQNTILLDPMIDPNPDIWEHHEWKHDRDNIVVENSYFKKWKSVWHIDMVKE